MNNFILYQCVIALCLSLSSLLAQSVEQKDKEFSMVCGSSKPKLFTNYKLQASSGKNLRVSQGVYKIPAVVHVISSTDCPPLSSERYRDFPTDGLIRAEIKEASQRFRHMHPSAEIYANPFYGADTEIELELTTVDPNGKFTSGINRIVDANAEGQSWTSLHAIINKYKWDTTKYCNIFVVKGMPDASGVYVYEGDFTVLNTTSFWSGLLNHELGHYLGLMHIFQTDIGSSSCPSNDNCLISGDQICDTPPRSRAGDPSEICGKGDMIVNSCSTDEADISTNNPYRPVALGGMGDQPDMLANYMDYTGRCWDSYTLGQKNKMRMNLEWRKEILEDSHSD